MIQLRNQFAQKLTTLSNDVDLRTTAALTSSSNATAETHQELSTTVNALALVTVVRIEALERNHFLRDVVINGIPFIEGEDVYAYFSKICETIAFSPNLHSILRLPRKDSTIRSPLVTGSTAFASSSSSKNNPPIIIKFINSDFSRNFIGYYLKFKTLNLTSIGFSSPSRIFVNENLTKPIRALFLNCVNTKKTFYFNFKCIYNTMIGLVHIKFAGVNKPIIVHSISEFDEFCTKMS